MGFEIQWKSRKGSRTTENWDFGGIGLKQDEALCILTDGASTRPHSGELAKAIAQAVIDRFIAMHALLTQEALLDWLKCAHTDLSPRFLTASASYIIVYIGANGAGFSAHAGDCLLAHQGQDRSPIWLTHPHTLANPLDTQHEIPLEAIASNAARHRLTRSFRTRDFIAPDFTPFSLFDDTTILASDGFWAEIDSATQTDLITQQAMQMPDTDDDSSVLTLRTKPATPVHLVSGDHHANLYVRQI